MALFSLTWSRSESGFEGLFMTPFTRREVLKVLPAAGAATLGVTASAVGAGFEQRAMRAFPQPEVRRPRPGSGRLQTRLAVRLTDQVVPGLGSVRTRTYEGSIPGPTLRVRAGDRIDIMHVNALPPNPSHRHADVNVPHDFNTFNLHTHGMHVAPTGIADNIFRTFDPAPRAGDAPRVYHSSIAVPASHPAGTFWYHPHHHGSTTTQLLNGMAGVLIVEGDIDQVPEIAAAKDVVVCITEMKLHGGRIPDLTSETTYSDITSTFLVNGARNPTLTLAPGEVQRWRLVNAAALTSLPLSLSGHSLHTIARDGITFLKPAAAPTVPLPMGGRADVLVRGGKPGTYHLTATGLLQPLITVVVTGTPRPTPMPLPTELPGRPTRLPAPVGTRELIFRSYDGVFSGAFPNAYRILGTGVTPHADRAAGVKDRRWGRFAPDFVNHRLRLGAVEEWTVRNESATHSNHPFHLHTNHFLVTSVGSTPLSTPVWHDTISIPQDSHIVFRVRFEDFTGRTVLHCHQLQHEDEGMMQIVEYTT
ncbi:multicopper oxidase family protein [Streptomyces lavendofoliae]|uniref:multicopper oxidase family protein n=1 Tax=Streptomyces lavendofoliae TaxID=67314 RepID=UPI003D8D510D